MKKLLKAILTLAAATTAFGYLASCSGGGEDEVVIPFETAGAVGNVVTFNIHTDSTDTSNKITMKYRRSEAGAKEKIVLQDAVYKTQLNGGEVKTMTGDLIFSLNTYGSCFCFAEGESSSPEACEQNHYNASGAIINSDNCAEYQCELSYGQALKAGDVVKFQIVNAKYQIEEDATAEQSSIIPNVKVVLVDAAPAVNYYKEIFTYTKEAEGGTGYPKVIKDGTTLEAGQTVDHGILDASATFMDYNQVIVPSSKFVGFEAGDSLVVTYTCPEAQYHQLQFVFSVESLKIEKNVNTAGSIEVQFNDAQAADVVANGLTLQGHGFTATKIVINKGTGTYVPPVSAGLLSEAFDMNDWGAHATVASSKFTGTDVKVLKFTIDVGTVTSDYVLKLKDGDWAAYYKNGTVTGGTLDSAATGDNEGSINFTAPASGTPTIVTYTPTAEEWTTLTSKGLVMFGYGGKITKLELADVE